jgi:hypothetical protein
VALEKLTQGEIADKTLRWEVLQTRISVLAGIFYLSTFGCFDKTEVFSTATPDYIS